VSGKGQKLPGVRYIGGSNGFRGFEGLCLAEPTPEMREGPVCAQSCWQRWPAGARVGWTAWVGSRTHKTHPSTHGDAPNPGPVPADRPSWGGSAAPRLAYWAQGQAQFAPRCRPMRLSEPVSRRPVHRSSI